MKHRYVLLIVLLLTAGCGVPGGATQESQVQKQSTDAAGDSPSAEEKARAMIQRWGGEFYDRETLNLSDTLITDSGWGNIGTVHDENEKERVRRI